MKHLFVLSILFCFLSCEKKDNTIATDPGGFAEFNINNKSDKHLKLAYILSDDYLNMQEIKVINAKESTMIFEGGSIAHIPKPDEIF